jgi:hypothetical protein
MSKKTLFTGIATTGALVLSSLLMAPAAHASEAVTPPVGTSVEASGSAAIQQITPKQLAEAIAEADRAGYVTADRVDLRGTRTTTIDIGEGFTFDIVQSDGSSRLGAGSDQYGAYVSFNSTDQNAIISGAAWGLGIGLCAISAGTFCVVAGAILTAATIAVTSNGIRCGSKSLRVYPFNGSRAPRCA